MGLGSVFKHMGDGDKMTAAVVSTEGQVPSKRQIYQNRYNHGPNLGGLFVLEKWISGESFYPNASGTSELDAVKAFTKANGKDKAREMWENHWKTWISDEDWKWMQDHGVTAVRAPIGYWAVNNGKFTKHTPFEKYDKVYSNAWTIYKEVVIRKAEQYGIAVLVDLHGLPGGANGNDHSGTCSGKAELWGSKRNTEIALDTIEFMAEDLNNYDNVCGIQIINEAPCEQDISKQKSFYKKAVNHIRKVNKDVPIVISDGWDLNRWVEFLASEESRIGSSKCPETVGVIIDTHVYRCFSDADKAKTPDQHIDEARGCVPHYEDVDILVGEYSCVLDGSTWGKLPQGANRDAKACEFGQREFECFTNNAKAGNYFWTYKFSWGGGGEWGFREMVEKGGIPSFGNLATKPQLKKRDFFDNQLKDRLQSALTEHQNYWNNQDQKKNWEHWRYEDGFKTGWEDAQSFNELGHSEIGRFHAWKVGRIQQHIKAKGSSDMIWEWNHGFDQAIKQFRQASAS